MSPRPRFTSFVILGAMRTGSNLLEKSLAAMPGVTVFGEAFNPDFPGFPDRSDLLGMDLAARDAAPLALFDRIRAAPGLTGFRYFPGHDQRVLSAILDDPACAKIVLSRNPLESYVSLKIARHTGQWLLTKPTDRRETRVNFDPDEFAGHLEGLASFYGAVGRGLRERGQTAFALEYHDLTLAASLSGLARHLGLAGDMVPSAAIVQQNPGPVADKLLNPEAAQVALAAVAADLVGRGGGDPGRGPAVRTFHAARGGAPLLFLPIPGGPVQPVVDWMGGICVGTDSGLGQADLREWMRARPHHRRFTVVRHPLVRAQAAFEAAMLGDEKAGLRDRILKLRKVRPALYDRRDEPEGRRALFLAFLDFLRDCLNGQTPMRPEPAWIAQGACIAGFAEFAPPDRVIREDEMAAELPTLARSMGASVDLIPETAPVDAIADDEELNRTARRIYPRDYLLFGG